jgi:hypothetical protein
MNKRDKRINEWNAQTIALSPELYSKALTYLFYRPVPMSKHGDEWYWNIDEPEFEATPLEWTKIQTLIFARSGEDLAQYSNEQVGMGLNYLISNSISNTPYQAIDPSVSLQDAMRMMEAFPLLWQNCIGPRVPPLIGIGTEEGHLGYVCYMWFDVWSTFWNVKDIPEWQASVWTCLDAMLSAPFRPVQVAALHGLGHQGNYLNRRKEIEQRVDEFIKNIDANDEDLKQYAQAAKRGMVQ